MTATELGIAAVDHDLNATNIDLVGLAQTGVEYNVYGQSQHLTPKNTESSVHNSKYRGGMEPS